MKTDYGLSLSTRSTIVRRTFPRGVPTIRYPYSIVKTKSVLTAVDCPQFVIVSDSCRVNNNYSKIVF